MAEIDDVFNDEVTDDAVREDKETQDTTSETEVKGDAPESAEAEQPETTDDGGETPSQETNLVPRAALQDERRKRQALEERIKSLQDQYGTQDDNAPDPVDDPEGYRKFVKAQAQNELRTELADTSRANMLEAHADYEEKEKYFTLMVAQDPSLGDKLKVHPDPARFAYETASKALSSTRESLKAEIMAELEKSGKLKATQTPQADVSNLINATGAGKNNGEKVEEVTQINQLFP